MPTALPRHAFDALLAFAAVGLCLLLPITAVPDAVLYHQLVSVGAWGGLWVWTVSTASGDRTEGLSARSGSAPLLAAGAVMVACSLLAMRDGVASQAGTAAVLVAAWAVLFGTRRQADRVGPSVAWAWWLAGVLCAAIAAIQYFAPALADGSLIATNRTPGRAVGNMRQPNHLATALLCAMVMTAWLWQAKRLHAGVASASIVAMVAAVGLSASRTGALSLGVLLVWALVDRGLPRAARWLLAATPLVYLACWAGLAEVAALQQAHFYGADRLQSGSDISSSRFAIWKNALTLIALHPWTGVGWGRFNFAWTFTPFPDRPVAFFDHTHNLLLQLAVEIGIPATVAVLGLLGWALWRARGAWQAGPGADGLPSLARAALVMLVVLGMHSMLEYPLWYAYFLLPAAWALGVFIGSVPRAGGATAAGSRARASAGLGARASPWLLAAAGVAMVAGAAYAAWDHRRIEEIFSPGTGAAPLDVRIAEGRKSLLFGHHADYAAVTNEPLDQHLASFRRPLLQLVDVRLLIAYIEALKANGRDAEALYAAQRLREFRRDEARAYFKACDGPAPPFQCERAPVGFTWRDLLPP